MNEVIRQFDPSIHRDQVAALWEQIFGYSSPHNAPQFVIDRKQAVGDGLLFVAEIEGKVVGSIMAGYDGHRGWLYALAVAPDCRRRGLGSRLVQHAEEYLKALGCPKINLQIMNGNEAVEAFYRKLGYETEPRISMGKKLASVAEVSRIQSNCVIPEAAMDTRPRHTGDEATHVAHSGLPCRRGREPRAFTLVELLVVITIIVVLMALLVPALDRAIYQAELAACASNLRGIGGGVTMYAVQNSRAYPSRLTVSGWGPNNLNDNAAPTGRVEESLVPMIRPYFSVRLFVDPLCGEIDLDEGANRPHTLLWANYYLYFGWGFDGHAAMKRLGQSFSWSDDGKTNRMTILAGDRDTYWNADGWTNAGHADDQGVLEFAAWQDEPPPWLAIPHYDDSTLSWWHAFQTQRGLIDTQFTFADGSTHRFVGVKRDDEKMIKTPEFRNGAQYAEGRVVQLPPR